MTFAVDSNVILDVLYADPKFAQLSIDTLTKAASQGKLISCDFLIGAHAFECADALITRDRGFLRKWFKTLKIIDPSKHSLS